MTRNNDCRKESWSVKWRVFLQSVLRRQCQNSFVCCCCHCRISRQLLGQMAVASLMSSTLCYLCLVIERPRSGRRKSASWYIPVIIIRISTAALLACISRRSSIMAYVVSMSLQWVTHACEQHGALCCMLLSVYICQTCFTVDVFTVTSVDLWRCCLAVVSVRKASEWHQ